MADRAGRAPGVLALGLVLAAGVAVRLGLLLHWPGRLNVDEATVGLMALHVLRGDFGIFFPGHGYMGAPEAYATAVVFAVAGVSPLTSKLAVFATSCLFVGVAYLLGARVGGQPAGLAAAWLTALGPPFLPVFGNYPMLGYVELVVVGSLLLLLVLRALEARAAGPGPRTLLALGLLAGVGWWLNPMMLSYLAAAGLALVWAPALRTLRAAALVTGGFLLGSLPFWLFNLTHAFRSFVLFQKGTEDDPTAALGKATFRLLEILGVHGMLADPVPLLSPAAGLVYLGLLAVLLADLARWRAAPRPDDRARRRGIALLLLFSLLQLAAFASSGYPGAARYLFPLYSAVPVLAAVAVVRAGRRWRALAVAALVLVLANNVLALSRTVGVYEAGRRADWWRPAPLVAFLQAEGLTRVYAFQRIAFRLTFETGERILAADPFFAKRYPEHLAAVDAAPRVAYILSDRLPELSPAEFEASLAGIGARYRRQDVGPFAVFFDFHPPPSPERLASLPPGGWRAVADPPGSDPTRAFDRDADTAWLSGEFARPGMWYRLDLGAAVPVAGVAALPVRPVFGAPAGYRVEISADGGRWEAVAAVPRLAVTLDWRDGQPRMERSGRVVSRFAPRAARYVRITQTGANPAEWWSLAEIFVYAPGTGARGSPPEVEAALREGRRLEKAGRLAAAAAAYEAAVARAPESADAHWRLLALHKAAGIPLDGTDARERARALEQLGRWARAVREYERLLAAAEPGAPPTDVLTHLAAAYRRSGAPARAAEVERRLAAEYAPPRRAEARFGKAVRLLGYDVAPAEPRAGEDAEISYYWQALEPTPEDWTALVHFVRDGKVRFQQDHEPLAAGRPTSRWREGELVRERYTVRLPADLPAGDYELRVGLWQPRTGKRLAVAETTLPRIGDQVRLATLRVLPPR